MSKFSSTPIDLFAVHAALEARILEITQVGTVVPAYELLEAEQLQGLTFPVVTVEINEFDPVEKQGGTEQSRYEMAIEIRVWMKAEPRAGLFVRQLAFKIAQALHQEAFNVPIGVLTPGRITDERYQNNEGTRYHIMLIEMTATATLGEDVWERPADTSIHTINAWVNGDFEEGVVHA